MNGTPKPKSGSGRRTNLALLILIPSAMVTGLVANTAGTTWGIHPAVYHGVVAFAVVLLTPWKQVIVRRGLRRWRKSTWVSLGLLFVVLATVTTGIVHAVGYRGRIGPLTLMQVHIGAALIALVLMWLHYRAHPVSFKREVDMSRRGFLRNAGFAALAGVIWVGAEGVLDVVGASGGRRRFTGSHERGSFDPDRLPVTSWLDDRVQNIDASVWSVDVAGRSMTLAEIETLPQDRFDAVLDCTSAWYSEQEWSGVRLDRLVEAGTRRSIEVRSETGYARRFPVRDLERLWLVTHVGGEPLKAGHGYPARIVAPDRRGFWWVKWVVSITPSHVPWWVQSPFPVT